MLNTLNPLLKTIALYSLMLGLLMVFPVAPSQAGNPLNPSVDKFLDPVEVNFKRENLRVTYTPVEIDAKLLRKNFWAYEVTVVNEAEGPITVLSATIANGMSGKQGFETRKKHVGIPGGAFFGPVGMAASGSWQAVKYTVNKKAKKNAREIESTFPKGTLKRGQGMTTITLVGKGEVPVLEVTYKDMYTGKILYVGE